MGLLKHRGKTNMCEKLKEIHGLTPMGIINRYVTNSDKAKNIKHILDNMNIKSMPVDFTTLEENLQFKGNDSILGMACSEGNNVVILYSKTLDSKNANYVMAHELAHCCMHLPFSSEFHVEMKTQNDFYSTEEELVRFNNTRNPEKKEEEANIFAADILLPKAEFVDYLNNMKCPTIESMSEHFGVPSDLIMLRLKSLKRTI